MSLFFVPNTLLCLPTVLQVAFTFWRLRIHSSSYMWQVLWLAMAGQLLAGMVATMLAVHGIEQRGIRCATGTVTFMFDGIILAFAGTPGLALLAFALRRLPIDPTEPTGSGVGL